MASLANICAVLVMVLAPFVQPCYCADFTLFCACSAAVSVQAKGDAPSCCGAPSDACDPTKDNPEPSPNCPGKDLPCKTPTIEQMILSAPLALVAPSPENQQAVLPPAGPDVLAPAIFRPGLAAQPPPGTCLIVVRTQFLRI